MKQLTLLLLLFACLGVSAQEPASWFHYYSDGRAVVKRDSLYGFVDRHGEEVIPCQYKKAYTFNNGLAMVRRGYEVFAIDTMGRRLDCRVRIPQFRGRDFESFVYYVQRRIPFASSDEQNRMRDITVNAVITIDKDGRITACEPAADCPAEAFSRVKEVVMAAPAWTPGAVDGQPVEIRYLLPIDFGHIRPIRCFAVDARGEQIPNDFVYPLFKGQYATAFQEWVYPQLRFPNAAAYYKAQEGLVRVLYTIDEKGALGQIEVVQSHDDSCRDLLLRVLKKSPRWSPGTIDGKAVAVRYDGSFYFNFR